VLDSRIAGFSKKNGIDNRLAVITLSVPFNITSILMISLRNEKKREKHMKIDIR